MAQTELQKTIDCIDAIMDAIHHCNQSVAALAIGAVVITLGIGDNVLRGRREEIADVLQAVRQRKVGHE